MNIKKRVLLLCTHAAVGFIGFMLGIYMLPILTAPPSPTLTSINKMSADSRYITEFTKNLKGSDFLHWGEGKVSLSNQHITLMGKLSPGPDFKLYLSPEFVETEAEFEQLKPSMKVIGDVNTFTNFIVDVPTGTDLARFNTVVVWCESFGEFITAAQYK
ncbi:DM13 domain-containing protein [Catenovulum sp. SM1970]|uniref:DM13 domain-containing protein n=1 Tax=Marinifaba aquimaris TaxID=2741323 RepID=UPI0015737003|nr:DM13 domain-containing protein [Marinifaba aquimaris]NTS76802.1 DM13 domain-containing protein [Marinifaba aquimaris]